MWNIVELSHLSNFFLYKTFIHIMTTKFLTKSKDKKTNKKCNNISPEITLNIEQEKTKQLQLIKDIKKIELHLKQKESYVKKKKDYFLQISEMFNDITEDSDEDEDLDLELNLDSDSDYDENLSSEEENNYVYNNKMKELKTKSESNNNTKNTKKNKSSYKNQEQEFDTISICSEITFDTFEDVEIVEYNNN